MSSLKVSKTETHHPKVCSHCDEEMCYGDCLKFDYELHEVMWVYDDVLLYQVMWFICCCCCYIRWCDVAWKAEPFVRLIVPGKQNGFLACTDIWFSENFLLMCFWSTFNIVQRKTNKEEYMSPKEDKKKKKRKRKKVLRKKERDIPTSNGQKIRNLTTK